MKKILALLLAVLMVFSVAACSKEQSEDTSSTEPASDNNSGSDYALSDKVPEGSIVDGVMTYIEGDDPILTKTTAEWLDTCVLYEVNVRQYTEEGTFRAFESHLDRLKAMGINTLWFMPIHPISETERKGTLGSYYAVDDYTAVNPEFGTLEDFQHLVDKAHDMGFKVILDWVANHTGWDNQWIKDHDEWFVHDSEGEITYPFDWSDVAELDFDNYAMRAEMIKSMQFWVEEVGVDGFRCDHASGVPDDFWNAAVYKLKSVNSQIMMLAEVAITPNLVSYAFDCCYNDNLYNQSLMILAGIGTEALKRALPADDRYVSGSFPMNYTDNHDKNSYEGTIYDRFDKAYEPMLALTFVAPGLPLVYTSNEQGYDHEIEFFEKDTIKWEDAPGYQELITELSGLKVEEKALASTNKDIEFVETSNSQCIAFSRTMGDSKVYYVANLFYEDVSGVDFGFDAEKAQCVIHYDGSEFDFEDKEIDLSEFDSKTFAPYEFYILTVK